MRKVVKPQEVAHLWANQLQYEAYNPNRSLYFERDTIYSYGYHFPIAKHLNGKILFTTRGYSNTTAKHISIVSSASSHIEKIYCYNPSYSRSENFEEWRKEAELVAKNLTNARKPEKYLNELGAIANQAQKYADFMGVEIPENLKIVLEISSKEEYKTFSDKKEELKRKQEEERIKREKIEHRESLKKWLKGESRSLYLRDGRDYLRVNGENVETSQGITLPVDVFKRYYNNLNSLKVGDKILSYEVLEVGKNIKIGCHIFPISYIQKFAKNI